MDSQENHLTNWKTKPTWRWLGFSLLGIVFMFGLILSSTYTSQAAPGMGRLQVPTSTPISHFPIILKEYKFSTPSGPTPTFTSTATSTSTSTSTFTATYTPTDTATATDTPTGTLATPTRTPVGPTRTNTLVPTETATGTITPFIVITPAVSPTQANIGQSFVFTFKIANRGAAPATGVAFLDSLPSSLDITLVTASKGTKISDLHSVTVAIGTLFPDELVTIVITARVNTGALTQNLSNTITVTYDVNKSKTASVSYRVVGSALPGTGELPLEPDVRAGPDLSLLFLSVTLGLGAIFAIWYGFWALSNKVTGVKWYFGIGLLLIAGAMVSGLVGSGLLQTGDKNSLEPVARVETPGIQGNATPEMLAGFEIAPAFEPTQSDRLPVYQYHTPEPLAALPDYPIPSPTILATPEDITQTVDTSPIVRLVIPSLEVNSEVKYVPWDNTLETWLITGLRQEIAWLGGSSWPGLGSNTVLAGHVTVRDYGNGPFRYLDKLAAGDEITVYTNAKAYTYRVRETLVVAESDLWVVDPSENPQLTLITCTDWDRDFQLYLKRLIVFADLERSDHITASIGSK